jgi:hypothetical protein
MASSKRKEYPDGALSREGSQASTPSKKRTHPSEFTLHHVEEFKEANKWTLQNVMYTAITHIQQQLIKKRSELCLPEKPSITENLIIVEIRNHKTPTLNGTMASTLDLESLNISSLIPNFETGYKLLIRIDDNSLIAHFFQESMHEISQQTTQSIMKGAPPGTPKVFYPVADAPSMKFERDITKIDDRYQGAKISYLYGLTEELKVFIDSLGLIPFKLGTPEQPKSIDNQTSIPFRINLVAPEINPRYNLHSLAWNPYYYKTVNAFDKGGFYELNTSTSENLLVDDACKKLQLVITGIRLEHMTNTLFSIYLLEKRGGRTKIVKYKIQITDSPDALRSIMFSLATEFVVKYYNKPAGRWDDPDKFANPNPFNGLFEIENIVDRINVLLT